MNARADLNALEAGGLIEIAALQPELEYLFRHALVQEATYSSLLKQDRRTLHRAAAETILALHPGREAELASVVAMHYEQAGDAQHAADYLMLAGEHALERFANREAFAFFTRATASATDAQVETRLRSAIGAAKAGWGFAAAATLIDPLELAVVAGDGSAPSELVAQGYFWLAFMRRIRGETPESSAELRRALERVAAAGEDVANSTATVVPRALMGAYTAFSGQLREGARQMHGALGVIEAKGDAVSAAMVANFLSGAYARLGDFASAAEIIEHSNRYAEKGDGIAIVDRDIAVAGYSLERGDTTLARESALQCSLRAEELGAYACVLASNVVTGAASLASNDAITAKVALERGSELTRVIDFAPLRTMTFALLGSARAQLGDMPGGIAGWNEALANARAMNDRYGEAQTLWGRGRTEARRPEPDLPAALGDLDRAIELFEEMEARPALARALLDRGSVRQRLGRSSEGAGDELRARQLARDLGLRDITDDGDVASQRP
jgi:tetratricopeptide (TPR) repeat protein